MFAAARTTKKTAVVKNEGTIQMIPIAEKSEARKKERKGERKKVQKRESAKSSQRKQKASVASSTRQW